LCSTYRQGIDIEVPCDLAVPNLFDCKLKPVNINVPEVECLDCKTKVRVIPDFITSGTTLTLAAQSLVAVFYHNSKSDGWRKINNKLCDNSDGIAHTTLYRAYHSMGKNLNKIEDVLLNVISESFSKYSENDIPQKSVKTNTRKREKVIMQFFLIIWLSIRAGFTDIWQKMCNLLELLTDIKEFKTAFGKRFIRTKRNNTS
jgi:hypothetical protein